MVITFVRNYVILSLRFTLDTGTLFLGLRMCIQECILHLQIGWSLQSILFFFFTSIHLLFLDSSFQWDFLFLRYFILLFTYCYGSLSQSFADHLYCHSCAYFPTRILSGSSQENYLSNSCVVIPGEEAILNNSKMFRLASCFVVVHHSVHLHKGLRRWWVLHRRT